MNQNQRIGFGARGWMLMIYQILAYAGYTAFTNFPQNILNSFYGGTTRLTLLNMIGGIFGYLITYFIVAPRIGKIKSVKRTGLCIGVVALIVCAAMCFTTPRHAGLWGLFFVLTLITMQLWGCFFVTLLIGNWFPRRKGTVMGIVTMAFPIVTGICLSLFATQFFGMYYGGGGVPADVLAQMMQAPGVADGALAALRKASIMSFLPYWIICVVGMLICVIFLKDFPEQCGAYRDNDRTFTPEMAQQMLVKELELRQKSVWKRSKIWGCKDWWLQAIPNSILLSAAMAFMVQIMPVLQEHTEELSVLAIPSFVLMADGYNAVLFGLAIFACLGSWLLGVIDTKKGVRTAVLITSFLMLLSGILGMIDNVWCVVASTWLLGLFMGASSNFGLSSIVRYWRHEDFPAVYSGAPPLGTVIGACMPYAVALIATNMGGYKYAFGFVAILAVICIICNRAFNPRGIIAYDNKLREAAGLPIDDELEQRLIREGHGKDKG